MKYKIVIGVKGYTWIWSNAQSPGTWAGNRYYTWPRAFTFTFELWHA